jgi:phage tail sheath protein FI
MTAYGRPGVYITERLLPAPLASTATTSAAGACVGTFSRGPITVTRVSSWYEFSSIFGGYDIAHPATFGVGMFFQNGGTELYVRRVLNSSSFATANLVTTAPATVATFTARTPGAEGNKLRVQATRRGSTSYYDVVVYRENGADAGTTDDIIVEQYLNVVFNDVNSPDYIVPLVNTSSQYLTMTIGAGASGVPLGTVLPLAGATTPDVAPTATNFTNAMEDFNTVERPLVIFAPEIYRTTLSTGTASTVVTGLVTWANANDGFAVVDTDANLPPTAEGTDPSAIAAAAGYGVSSNAAVYYPHVFMADPLGRNSASIRKVGPAGAVAGLYLSTDRQFGPYKAPAGLRTALGGVVATERVFTSANLDDLNSSLTPVNAIRSIPGAGVVVMGARTLKQDGTANRYVSMRRSLIYLKKELQGLTQFALFENNDADLWARLRTSIGVFLTGYLNQGGLAGAGPTEAFFVKCDRENNSTDTVANGEVHIEVGVALEYPAEFVVLTLSQKTAA